MVETKQGHFLNVTGRFFPEPPPKQPGGMKRLMRHFRAPRLTERETVDVFWTLERQQLAQKVVVAINQELEPFGAPPIEFRPNQVRFLPQEQLGSNTAGCHWSRSGYIDLSVKQIDPNEIFIHNYIHEFLHHVSLRLFQRRGRDYFSRRYGLKLGVKPLGNGNFFFEDISEGVTQITTSQILQKYFDLEHSINWEGQLVNGMCLVASAVNKDYLSSEDMVRVFQKATFGKGRLLELGRIIEKTYGRGGFRTLGRLLKEIPRKDKIADFGSPEYGTLMHFIGKPLVEFRFQQACKRPEDLIKCFPGFDFSGVPEGIPLEDFIGYDERAREGVFSRLADYSKYLIDHIQGQISLQAKDPQRTYFSVVSGGKSYRYLVKEACEGLLYFPGIFANTDYMRGWSGTSNTTLVKPEEIPALVLDSQIDEQVKNLLFDYFGKGEEPAATVQEEDFQIDFYPVKRSPDNRVDIYCLVGKNLESGLEIFALAVGPKGGDPGTW